MEVSMAEQKDPKMSKKDLEYFESLLLEKRREIVAAQVGSSSSGAFHTQKHQMDMVGYSNYFHNIVYCCLTKMEQLELLHLQEMGSKIFPLFRLLLLGIALVSPLILKYALYNIIVIIIKYIDINTLLV
mgnify:CR=1 FL=1